MSVFIFLKQICIFANIWRMDENDSTVLNIVSTIQASTSPGQFVCLFINLKQMDWLIDFLCAFISFIYLFLNPINDSHQILITAMVMINEYHPVGTQLAVFFKFNQINLKQCNKCFN